MQLTTVELVLLLLIFAVMLGIIFYIVSIKKALKKEEQNVSYKITIDNSYMGIEERKE